MNNNTYTAKISEVKNGWKLLDADNEVLGRLATKIAVLLMGKDKTNYSPNLNFGENVVVINSKNIVLTGNKEMQKMYRRHSGMVGHLHEKRAELVRETNPNRMIFEAVKGMLPKNRLRKVRLANLHIYEGEEHPHKSQFN
jgi:large subunit ribosomal protein L13